PDVVRIACYPAIVSQELFLAAQDALFRGKKKTRRDTHKITPLAGLCRCGACASPMCSCRQGPYPYYCCKRRHDDGAEGCPASNYSNGDESLNPVLATLAERLLDGDTVSRLVDLAGQAEDEGKQRWEADVTAARKALEAVDAKLTTARRRLADADEDLLDDFKRVVRELKDERAALDAE